MKPQQTQEVPETEDGAKRDWFQRLGLGSQLGASDRSVPGSAGESTDNYYWYKDPKVILFALILLVAIGVGIFCLAGSDSESFDAEEDLEMGLGAADMLA